MFAPMRPTPTTPMLGLLAKISPSEDRGRSVCRASMRILTSLRIDAAELGGFGDATDRYHVRGPAHVHVVLFRFFQRIAESFGHLALEPLVDFVFFPEVLLEILHPLEIRHRDAAGVGEDVGQYRSEEH